MALQAPYSGRKRARTSLPSTESSDNDERDGIASDRNSIAVSALDQTTSHPAKADKKPRKPTYAVMRDEKAALKKELRVLEARVELLRAHVGAPSLRDTQTLEKVETQNKRLADGRRQQMMLLCGAESMLASHLRLQYESPLKVEIRLGKDLLERREVLLGMRSERLEIARQYIEEKLRGIDRRQLYEEEQSWTSSNGDLCFHRADVSHFEGLHGLKPVYDALMFYMTNMEISISEVLGQLTLREDIDCVDNKVSNHRILSSTERGVGLEVNMVSYGEYYERCSERNGEEFAILTNDTVDEDELYPYSPAERVRKNVTAAVSLSTFRKSHTNGKNSSKKSPPQDDGELVVVLQRSAYLTIVKPQFEVSTADLRSVGGTVAAWGHVMNKTIRDHVYTRAALEDANQE